MSHSPRSLGDPVSVGGVMLRNRLVMAPITTNYGDADGYATDKTVSFYEERARGGAGAIILEASSVSANCRLAARQHGLHDDRYIPGLAEVARRVHAHGAKLFVQIAHGGAKAASSLNGVQPVSASDLPVKMADIPRPISIGEIEQAIKDFARAAVRAREAGFDGVELHAAHFYLLSCFLSGHLNRRSDEYGGSLENRARLTCRVIKAVKSAAGTDFPVICRIHGREALPGGINEAEAGEISRLLAEAGADAIHVSAATLPVNPKIASFYAVKVGGPPTEETPHGCFAGFAASVKAAIDIPVIAVGKLNDTPTAQWVVETGAADLVAIGRGLIADPYLSEKMLTHRWSDIVHCKDCLTCHTTFQKGYDMGCTVNPKPWRPKGPQGAIERS